MVARGRTESDNISGVRIFSPEVNQSTLGEAELLRLQTSTRDYLEEECHVWSA
jgi:hypothetical protein